MGTPKRKRTSARHARKPLSPRAPVVLLLPRHPDDFEPRRTRAPRAPRRPSSGPATRPALSARPPVADGAPSKRARATVTTTAGIDHPERVGRKNLDVTNSARVRLTSAGPPRGGTTRRDVAIEPGGSTRPRRQQPSKPLPAGTSHRPLVFRASSRNRHALQRAAADPEFPVSRRRTAVQTPPPAVPSNPCRSVRRRPWVQSRPGNRSKRYPTFVSPASSAASVRSVPLNSVRKLIATIREHVRRLATGEGSR